MLHPNPHPILSPPPIQAEGSRTEDHSEIWWAYGPKWEPFPPSSGICYCCVSNLLLERVLCIVSNTICPRSARVLKITKTLVFINKPLIPQYFLDFITTRLVFISKFTFAPIKIINLGLFALQI